MGSAFDVDKVWSRSLILFRQNGALLIFGTLLFMLLNLGASYVRSLAILTLLISIFYYNLELIGATPYLLLLAFAYLFSSVILTGPLVYGLFRMSLMLTRGEPVVFADLFSGFKVFPMAFKVYGIFFVMHFGILFVPVLGLFVYLIHVPVWLFLIDGESDIRTAFSKCRTMITNNHSLWLLLCIILLVINTIGFHMVCVGLLVSIPLSFLLISVAYDESRN